MLGIDGHRVGKIFRVYSLESDDEVWRFPW